jgi:hypothetical protein
LFADEVMGRKLVITVEPECYRTTPDNVDDKKFLFVVGCKWETEFGW